MSSHPHNNGFEMSMETIYCIIKLIMKNIDYILCTRYQFKTCHNINFCTFMCTWEKAYSLSHTHGLMMTMHVLWLTLFSHPRSKGAYIARVYFLPRHWLNFSMSIASLQLHDSVNLGIARYARAETFTEAVASLASMVAGSYALAILIFLISHWHASVLN